MLCSAGTFLYDDLPRGQDRLLGGNLHTLAHELETHLIDHFLLGSLTGTHNDGSAANSGGAGRAGTAGNAEAGASSEGLGLHGDNDITHTKSMKSRCKGVPL